MELRTFIKTALLDIINAVKDAQVEVKGKIVPGGVKLNYESVKHGVSEIQVVDFEVMVEADESKGSEGKLGVVNSIIGAGIAGKSESGVKHSNVLKFRIPIKLPTSGNVNE
jgi:hypothetical protein